AVRVREALARPDRPAGHDSTSARQIARGRQMHERDRPACYDAPLMAGHSLTGRCGMAWQRWPVTVGVLVLILFAPLAAQDVSGTWTAAFETQVGEQQYTYEYVVKGAELTGTIKGSLLGDSAITEGKVDGKTITFVENG